MIYNETTLFSKDGWELLKFRDLEDNTIICRIGHNSCGFKMQVSVKYGYCIGCGVPIPNEMIALYTLYNLGIQ